MLLLKAKMAFFDRKAVRDALTRSERKVLPRFGAFVRTRDRSSQKKAPLVNVATGLRLRGRRAKDAFYREASAEAGKPPYYHKGRQLKDLTFFGLDMGTHSVVIGPVPFGENAARAIEQGGETRVKRKKGGARMAFVRPHPHTKPALDAELPKAAALWKDEVK